MKDKLFWGWLILSFGCSFIGTGWAFIFFLMFLGHVVWCNFDKIIDKFERKITIVDNKIVMSDDVAPYAKNYPIIIVGKNSTYLAGQMVIDKTTYTKHAVVISGLEKLGTKHFA